MIHLGDPRTGIAGEVSYAPFEPRVAFTFSAEVSTVLPELGDQVRRVYFEKLPSVAEVPVPERASATEFAEEVPLSESPWTGPGRREPARRALDLALSFILLVALAPLLGAVAIALRVLDGGRLLVHDRRIGRSGREIDLLSFRTRSRNNPRMLQFGRFLRQSGISSLLRLLNVFRGDLTLVGPRPVRGSELPRYGPDVIHYLASRPGLTGEWQSAATRKLRPAARCQLERTYARTRTFEADLKYLLQMLPASIAGKSRP